MRRPTPYFLVTLAALCLALGSVAAFADDTLSWKLPTQYTDGSALNSADISGVSYRYFEGATQAEALASDTVAGSGVFSGSAVSGVVARDATAPGTRCYQASVIMLSGAQSSFAPAGKVCKTIAPPAAKKPKVITGLKVE